jgi:hypothetical protein
MSEFRTEGDPKNLRPGADENGQNNDTFFIDFLRALEEIEDDMPTTELAAFDPDAPVEVTEADLTHCPAAGSDE